MRLELTFSQSLFDDMALHLFVDCESSIKSDTKSRLFI